MDWRERFQKFARNFLVTSAHALKWGLVLHKESINTQYQTKLDNGVNCTWKWVSCIHALMNKHRWTDEHPRIHVHIWNIYFELDYRDKTWIIEWLIARIVKFFLRGDTRSFLFRTMIFWQLNYFIIWSCIF